MDDQSFDPMAGILVDAYAATGAFSAAFTEERQRPPTTMAKAHYMLSVVQAAIQYDERFALGQLFAEFGRVEILDRRDARTYVLRSRRAISIDEATRQRETLFDPTSFIASDVRILVHQFHADGLDLSIAGACKVAGRSRLVTSGPPTYISTWPYSVASGTGATFDQSTPDLFADLGDLDVGEEGGL